MPCYLLRAGDTDKVKIGFATDVTERMAVLQSAHWERLALLRTWDGDLITEGWLHKQFASARTIGEWFTFDTAMLEVEPPDLSGLRPAPSSDPDPILADVERFLSDTGMTATAFGKRTAKDPMLVHEMRRGRELRRAIRTRIQDFIRSQAPAEAANTPAAHATENA